jgi:hypothetical protein
VVVRCALPAHLYSGKIHIGRCRATTKQIARSAPVAGAARAFSNRYITFQMAGVPVSRQTFVDILSLIARAPGHHSHPHMGAHGIKCGERQERRCALMLMPQPA